MTQAPIDVATEFLTRLSLHDVDGALEYAAAGAAVEIIPLGISGLLTNEGHDFLNELVAAFPDLELRIRRIFVGGNATVVAEITTDGTQAAPFLGVIDQEKHVDLDQAWTIHVTNGLIDRVKMFWCQNQLYRRLGVRRLDRVTITA